MRVVIGLGGNALLRRGEPPTQREQRQNAGHAASALAAVIHAGHEVIVTHGNGPQVGLMALQDAAYDPRSASSLDVLCAESQGMIGYLVGQELGNLLGSERSVAAVLTRIEVDPADPAFKSPTKPIGPLYGRKEAEQLASSRGWHIMRDGEHFRRAVPSPRPMRIVEIDTIRTLINAGAVVICAGGGGIPIARRDDGRHEGVEAIVDKDHTSGLLASHIGADALLMLTDVDGVYLDWDTDHRKLLKHASPPELQSHRFAAGTMAPKIEAACDFVSRGGRLAGIGRLEDALAILEGKAGTRIAAQAR